MVVVSCAVQCRVYYKYQQREKNSGRVFVHHQKERIRRIILYSIVTVNQRGTHTFWGKKLLQTVRSVSGIHHGGTRRGAQSVTGTGDGTSK